MGGVAVFWLVVVLASWRVLTREYWRTQIVPAGARVWAWCSRYLPERGLLALYRATFFYGVCRMIARTVWAHVIEDYPLTSRGPGRGGSGNARCPTSIRGSLPR